MMDLHERIRGALAAAGLSFGVNIVMKLTPRRTWSGPKAELKSSPLRKD